jgi:NADH-quinone oxidoreductase subunit N
VTVSDLWLAIPLLILACSALLVLLLGAIFRNATVYTGIGVVATVASSLWVMQTPPALKAANLGLSGTPISRIFVALFSLTACFILIISRNYTAKQEITGEEYPATVLFATFGAMALSMATDLLVMFLGLEAMTFGFYILVAMDLKRSTSAEAGVKYLLMGAVAAAFMAFGIALLYTATGSMKIAGLLQLSVGNPIALAGWGFFLSGIAFKLSLIPAHLWTPDVYQGAPTPVAGFLSAASKGATVAMLLLILATGTPETLRIPLWWLSLLSMTIGNLAALMQNNVRRMLAYSSIAQMGYTVMALLGANSGGMRAAAFYSIAYAAMSLAAFGSISIIESSGYGSSLERWRGLGRRSPFIAGILTVALLSLAGIPPTLGFTGKFLIFTAAIKAGETTLAVVGILSAALSVYYYLKVVVTLYMHEPSEEVACTVSYDEAALLAATASVIVILGLFPSPLLRLIATALP